MYSEEQQRLRYFRTYVSALKNPDRTEDWPEKIAVERIQTLVLIGSPSGKALDRNSMRSSGQIASKAESSSLELVSRDSTQADGKVADADRVDNADAIDSSREEHFRDMANSGIAASG